jgi:hypothetical protein
MCRWLPLVHKNRLAPLSNAPFATPWARKHSSIAQRFRPYVRAPNCEELSETRVLVPSELSNPNGLIILTQKGYLLLVKPLRDETAWQVQAQMVDAYFAMATAGLPTIIMAPQRPAPQRACVARARTLCHLSQRHTQRLIRCKRWQLGKAA